MEILSMQEYLQKMLEEGGQLPAPNPSINRPGRVIINKSMAESEVWLEVLEQTSFVPFGIKIKWLGGSDYAFEYAGCCSLFREIEQSEPMPEYTFQITTGDSGSIDEVLAVEL